MRELNFRLSSSLISTLSIKEIAKRHEIKVVYQRSSKKLALKGASKDLTKLQTDRGWQQFVMINHAKRI